MITFSGIDCSGKSTQIDILKNYYDGKGLKSKVIWNRGGYTSWVEAIKNLVRLDKNYTEKQKKEYRSSINSNPKKAKLLLFASILDLIRFYGIVFRIIELLGVKIICDRYIWDTYIDFKIKYPQYNFENWFSWRLLLRCMKKPDHSIIFVIPAEESMRRSELKFEPFPETYEERIIRIEYYIREITNGKWNHVIDGQQNIDDVTRQVLEKINA